MKNFRHVLSRLSVLLSTSAFLTCGARATVADGSMDQNEAANAARIGEVIVKLDNDQICYSQDGGRTFEWLEATGTPEAARLRGLLSQRDRSGIKVSPTVVADGAGGLQWARPNAPRAKDSGNGAPQATVATPVAADKAPSDAGPKVPAHDKPE
jgi:hypothetical protein